MFELQRQNEFSHLRKMGTLKFKQTTGTHPETAMTVCAFLNGSDGRVLFGVTEARAGVGQQVSERTVEELKAEFRQVNFLNVHTEMAS